MKTLLFWNHVLILLKRFSKSLNHKNTFTILVCFHPFPSSPHSFLIDLENSMNELGSDMRRLMMFCDRDFSWGLFFHHYHITFFISSLIDDLPISTSPFISVLNEQSKTDTDVVFSFRQVCYPILISFLFHTFSID